MFRTGAMLCVLLALSACAAGMPPVSRAQAAMWAPGAVKVSVPARLVVSEENGFVPDADIVWQEDLEGDPRQQVGRIVEAGATRAMARLTGARPVILAIEVQSFHALTRRARYAAPWGRHNIRLHVQAFDALTGRAVSQPTVINARLEAYTRDRAIAAERRGITQRVRIAAHIETVIAQWMGV